MKISFPGIKVFIIIICVVVCVLSGFSMLNASIWDNLPLYFFGAFWVGLLALSTNESNLTNRSLILMSVLLFTFGFPPYHGWSMLIAFTPFLWSFNREIESESSSTGTKFYSAFLAVLGYNIFTTYWVSGASFSAGIFAFVVNALIMTIPILLTGWFVHKSRKPVYWLLLVPFWVTYEFFHHNWGLSWPWLTLGNAFALDVEVVQWYKWTSVFGGSVWILLVNVLVLLVILSFSWKVVWSTLVAIVAPVLISLLLFYQPAEIGSRLKVLTFNPGLEPHFESPQTNNRQRFEILLRNLDKVSLDTIDLILIPETFLDQLDLSKLESNSVMQSLRALAVGNDLQILLGAGGIEFYKEKLQRKSVREHIYPTGDKLYFEVFNNAIFVKADTTLVYNKKKFVPGAEKFPFQNILGFFEPIVRSVGGTIEGLGDFERDETFPMTKDINAGPVICYEADYASQCRKAVLNGAHFLAIISEDGWWGNTAGYKQQFHINRLRSIEQNRFFARAANDGWSGFVDSKGKILDKSSTYGQEGCLVGEIQVLRKQTFYTKYGNLVCWICTFFSIILSLIFQVRRLF